MPLPFQTINLVDFEYYCPDGENPRPLCMVVREFRTGRLDRYGEDELRAMSAAPFDCGGDAVMVAYSANAELRCFLRLGWPFPRNIVDLYLEWRHFENWAHHGPAQKGRYSIIGCLLAHGLEAISGADKERFRSIAMQGGPRNPEEALALVDYCQTDVDALYELLPAMKNEIGWPHALFRGGYQRDVARIENAGVPVDRMLAVELEERWEDIRLRLIEKVDADYHVYQDGVFKQNRFASFLSRNKIPWPRNENGSLSLDGDTFKEQARFRPSLEPLHQLRSSLGQLRKGVVPIGCDQRNRCSLFPMATKTGRHAPSTTKFIFARSAWQRHLVTPPPGYALLSLDWSQQEYLIAGALSGDKAMIQSYLEGCPYIGFAKLAGAVPVSATKKSHPEERKRFKVASLATLYGQGARSLAGNTGLLPVEAKHLLWLHKQSFPRYHEWSQRFVHGAFTNIAEYRPRTRLGWEMKVDPALTRPTTLVNWPMQAHGAAMLHYAVIEAHERGVEVVAVVHDALVVLAPIDAVEDVKKATIEAMNEASRQILHGHIVRVDVARVMPGERYQDERGTEFFARVSLILAELTRGRKAG